MKTIPEIAKQLTAKGDAYNKLADGETNHEARTSYRDKAIACYECAADIYKSILKTNTQN